MSQVVTTIDVSFHAMYTGHTKSCDPLFFTHDLTIWSCDLCQLVEKIVPKVDFSKKNLYISSIIAKFAVPI